VPISLDRLNQIIPESSSSGKLDKSRLDEIISTDYSRRQEQAPQAPTSPVQGFFSQVGTTIGNLFKTPSSAPTLPQTGIDLGGSTSNLNKLKDKGVTVDAGPAPDTSKVNEILLYRENQKFNKELGTTLLEKAKAEIYGDIVKEGKSEKPRQRVIDTLTSKVKKIEDALGDSSKSGAINRVKLANEVYQDRTVDMLKGRAVSVAKSIFDGIGSFFEAQQQSRRDFTTSQEEKIKQGFKDLNIPEADQKAFLEKYSPRFQKDIQGKSLQDLDEDKKKALERGREPLQKTFEKYIDDMTPDNPDVADQIVMGIGSMAGFYGASVLTGGGSVVPAVLEAISEAGSVYEENKKDGKSVDEAFINSGKTLVSNLVWNAVLNKFSGIFEGLDDSQVKKIKDKILATVNASGWEGIQEAGQQLISNINTGREDVWEGVLESLGIGAIIGGGAMGLQVVGSGGGQTQIKEDLKPEVQKQVFFDNSGKPVDSITQTKAEELVKRDILSPISEELENKGYERFYQAITEGGESDWYFKTPEALAKYMNLNTTDASIFRFEDRNDMVKDPVREDVYRPKTAEQDTIKTQQTVTEDGGSIKEKLTPDVIQRFTRGAPEVIRKPKTPEKLFRGVGKDGRTAGTSALGKGLYTTTSRVEAERFGDNILELGADSIPTNPLTFASQKDYTKWILRIMNSLGYKTVGDVKKAFPEINPLIVGMGFDGVAVKLKDGGFNYVKYPKTATEGKSLSKDLNKPTKKIKQKSPGLPVQVEGVVKDSALSKRLSEQLLSSNPAKYEFNDSTGKYNALVLEEDAKKAVEFLEKNPEEAIAVSLGVREAPSGQTVNAIGLATALKAREEGNYALYSDIINSVSLRSTRMGQEIVTLRGQFNDDSAENYVKRAIDAKMGRLAGNLLTLAEPGARKMKAKKVVMEKIQKEAVKLKETLNKEQKKVKMAQDIIDALRC